MGVKNLLDFLRRKNPAILKKFNFSDLKGTKMAIDVAIQTFKYKSRFRTGIVENMDILEGDLNLQEETLFMCREYLKLIFNTLKAGIIPISVFDGKAPALKTATQAKRRSRVTHTMGKVENLRRIGKELIANPNALLVTDDLNFLNSGFPKPITTIGLLMKRLETELKAAISVSQDERNLLMNLLRKMGLPCITAPNEAEFLCSQLCVKKEVTSVLSADSDCLMYGCPIFITKIVYLGGHIIPKPPQGELYLFKDVQIITGLSREAFRDFCIMCGTDFNDNSPGIGPDGNFVLIKTFGSIPKIIEAKALLLEKMRQNNISESNLSKYDKVLYKLDPSFYNYDEVIKFMTTPSEYNPEDLVMKISKPHVKTIKPLLKEEIEPKLFQKCEVYIDRILELMENFFRRKR